MILQRVTYPRKGTTEEGMYVYAAPGPIPLLPGALGVAVIGEEERIEAGAYRGTICFETYFNTFSLKKWQKYTQIGRVSLQIGIRGRARVVLTAFRLFRDRAEKYVVASFLVDSGEMEQHVFEYPPHGDEEVLGFCVQPLADGVVIQGGAYVSPVDEGALPPVRVALAICTYRREEYVARNLDLLKEEVFDRPDSLLYGHVRACVVDNGNTLDAGRFDGRFVRVFPNKNSGGSGGFSRGAIEALADREYSPTHVILMDDDIVFEIGALERTYAFLRLLKEDYRLCLLGGAMFRDDQRHMQHAAGETNTLQGIVFNKIARDMFDIANVVRNEREEPINYLGWWYCCVPAEVFARTGFSLPLFVQYDDIEFSMRCGDMPKMTLNGVCCWHLPFDKKWSATKNYYTIRNRAIVDALYFDGFGKRILKRRLLKECLKRIFQFSYKEANLALMAGEDFMKGMNWLVGQDPSELNLRVISQADKLVETGELSARYDPTRLKRASDMNMNQIRRYLRWLTLNGWLLPARKEMATVEVDDPPLQFLFRVRSALKYDELTGKAILARKSYREAFSVLGRMVRLFFRIDRDFNRKVKEYRELAPQARTEAFWRKFLGF